MDRGTKWVYVVDLAKRKILLHPANWIYFLQHITVCISLSYSRYGFSRDPSELSLDKLRTSDWSAKWTLPHPPTCQSNLWCRWPVILCLMWIKSPHPVRVCSVCAVTAFTWHRQNHIFWLKKRKWITSLLTTINQGYISKLKSLTVSEKAVHISSLTRALCWIVQPHTHHTPTLNPFYSPKHLLWLVARSTNTLAEMTLPKGRNICMSSASPNSWGRW